MSQLLFLDFDGVLNNTAWFERQAAEHKRKGQKHDLGKPYNEADDFDPENLAQLKALADALPALRVVVSSSWRKGRGLADLRTLLVAAVPRARVVGVTPSDESRMRYVEIQRFLKEWPFPVARWLAFDDDTHDMHQLGANFLHVDRERGLTPAHVELAKDWFLRP